MKTSFICSLIWFTFWRLGSYPVTAEEPEVCFLLLGDWGKGGESGKTASVVLPIEVTKEQSTFTSEGPLPNNSYVRKIGKKGIGTLEGGGGGGGGGTNQVAIASRMHTYASSATCKPSFVVSLGDNFYTVRGYLTFFIAFSWLLTCAERSVLYH